ncbi:Endothiapepsin [Cladobotryum mycophilum]|uniref:Endothiapepsin n=1 Tax=Cladobotryum mycophilum TaxID=491253 RepID=A0ABR0SP85_9HYPO
MQPATSFGSFLVAALTVTLAAGSVIPSIAPGSFEIKRAANPNFTSRNGPLALARVYMKYGSPVPESLIQAVDKVEKIKAAQLSKRVTGSAPASPREIGTPAQTLHLNFDSGSSDLWVMSTETDGDTSKHSIFDPEKSTSTKKLTGASWDIEYGDGSTSSGDVYIDTVSVGPLTFDSQAVESAKNTSGHFIQGANDGVLGLAFGSLNTVTPDPQKTFFENIAPTLDANLFVADLRHDTPGSYTFGSIPEEAGEVLYAPADTSGGFWQFSTSNSLGGESFDTIADTGTTLIVLSPSRAEAYYKQIKSAVNDKTEGGYIFDCNDEVPDYTFTVGGGTITIPNSLIRYDQYEETCFGGIQTAEGIPVDIFGDVALKAAYVVFDAGNNQVGWAQKN